LSDGAAARKDVPAQTTAQPATPRTAPAKPKEAFLDYAVAAGETQAAQAGVQLLEQGGSAADAAAAVMLTLGVTQAVSSGIAGGGFALYYDAGTRKLTFLDFRERAPAAAGKDLFKGKPESASRSGGLAVAIPGEPAGIELLLKRFGRLPRTQVVAPAARLADNGFYLSPYGARTLNRFAKDLPKDPLFASWLGPDNHVEPGQLLRNPNLAATLRTFGREGSAPFYRGDIGKAIVEAIHQRGGVMTREDLQAYRVIERTPLRGDRLGYTWISAPPPSAGGYTLLSSLALLEQWWGKGKLPKRDAAWLHQLAESWKGPFLDRSSYFGDPDFVKVPLTQLLDPQRLTQRAQLFSKQKAQSSAAYALPLEKTSAYGQSPAPYGTSHICVVDGKGNIASVTTSVNYFFGAQFSVRGMLLNDTMDDFAREGSANLFGLPSSQTNLPAPGKTPVSSMTPTLVFKGNDPVLCIGGSGGSRIITAVEQAALNILLFGDTPQAAVARPRIHHQGIPEHIEYEANTFDNATLETLKRLGHTVKVAEGLGNVQAIRIKAGSSPRLLGGSDPHKGAYPAGL